MKNKKVTYGLLLGVLVLWGMIGYRVWMVSAAEELPELPVVANKDEYFKLINHENDSIRLNFSYRDPFSASSTDFIEDRSENEVSIKNPPPILPMAKPLVNWLGIRYTGYITNPGTKIKLILITLNGKELMFAQGQSQNGLKLIKYAGDSVYVNYQQESKYIKLN